LKIMPTFLLLLAIASRSPLSATSASPARELVHLLDYLAQDYAGAVENGQIISRDEFAEMQEFARRASELPGEIPELSGDATVRAQLAYLSGLVEQHAPLAAIREQAMAIKATAIRRTNLPRAPRVWPDIQRGAAMYQQACVACHGTSGIGDGPAATGMNPSPANLRDDVRMRQISPFGVFNTIRLGVTGTAMPSFSTLSDDETWALAFYVIALRHKPDSRSSSATPASLDHTASLSDDELEARASGSAADKRAVLVASRLHSGAETTANTLSTARSLLREAGTAYAGGDVRGARQKALLAYLDGIEPAEARLRAESPGSVALLERRMAAVRTAIEETKPPAVVDAAVREALREIDRVEARAKSKPSRWVVFWLAAAIVVREGFEAILIVIAILSILRRIGATHAAIWVHVGWIVALALGAVAWLLSDYLLRSSGLQRELLEGLTALVAVAILLYFGLWLHRRAEIGRWKAFIEDQVKNAMTGQRLFALTSVSFLAVFREVIETVLFLTALSLEGGPDGKQLMAAGVASSMVFTIALAWVLVRVSRNLPLKILFTTMSALMIVLAVMLAGKGLHSLQEAGLVGYKPMPFNLQIDWLGIFPSAQTVVAQLVIASLAGLLWWRSQAAEPQ
jgi:high-affinity iron transporter